MTKFRLIALAGALFATPALAASPVHVRTTGSGADCWVLLHPLGMSGKYWDRRARLLADRHTVRVYAPDLPNHGASALVARFDYDLATEAVAKALGPVCPHPTMIIGASSGGIVAMKLAARVGSIAAVVGVGWSFTPENLRSLQRQSRPSEGQDKYLKSFAEQGDAQVKALYKSFKDLASIGTKPLLKPAERRVLAGQLLIINGENDNFFLPSSVERLNREIANSMLQIIEGADHLGPLRQPHADRSWALIEGFAPPGLEPIRPPPITVRTKPVEK